MIDYLSTPGLSDDHVSRVSSLLLATQSAETNEDVGPRVYRTGAKAQNTVSLFLAEEQEIFRTSLLSAFSQRASLTLVGSADGVGSETLISAGLELRPQVVVLGVKGLQPGTVETMERLHEACPDIAIVLLFSFGLSS